MKYSRKMRRLTLATNHWKDYPCDKQSLERLVSGELKDGIKMLEIGAWLGRTTLLFAELLCGTGTLYVLDNWHGTDFWGSGNAREEGYKNREYFHTYLENIQDVYQQIHILNMASQIAAGMIKDEYFDVIFLDADHRYHCVRQDILNWWPKLANGGLFIGHDCEATLSNLPELKRSVMASDGTDFLKTPPVNGHPGIHPGVIRAVNELFDDEVQSNKFSSIWSVRKTFDIRCQNGNRSLSPVGYTCFALR